MNQNDRFYDPERAILGAMILDKANFIKYRNVIKPEFFGSDPCKTLYRFMVKSGESLDEWDSMVFESYCPINEPLGYTQWMDLYKSSEGLKEYIKIISLRYISRKLDDGNNLPAEMRIDEVEQFIDEFKKISMVREKVKTSDQINNAIEVTHRIAETGPEMPFPYDRLTEITGGFIRQEMLAIIAGTTQSKTVFLHNLTMSALGRRKKVICYDYELPVTALIWRHIAMHTKVPLDWMVYSRQYKKREKITEQQRAVMQTYMEGHREYLKDRLIIKGPATLDDIEADLASYEPDIVLVDTIQALGDTEPMRRGDSRADHLTRIARALQSMAKKYDVAVAIVAQINKANQTQIPNISDIYGASGIANNAATIIAVRDAYYSTNEEADKNRYDVVLRKSRHGIAGRFKFWMNKEIALITEDDQVDNIEDQMGEGF